MPATKLVLTFPPRVIRDPVMYRLVKDFDLVINIVSASISADEAGHMVVELTGDTPNLNAGLGYLDAIGVAHQPLSREVLWREERCVHCTACVTACPTEALAVDRREMRVTFDGEKCIGCELCMTICSYNAIEILF
jgi:Fe-S-cluster-containing hydrogenase component 2